MRWRRGAPWLCPEETHRAHPQLLLRLMELNALVDPPQQMTVHKSEVTVCFWNYSNLAAAHSLRQLLVLSGCGKVKLFLQILLAILQ